jgi:hypothetical protein
MKLFLPDMPLDPLDVDQVISASVQHTVWQPLDVASDNSETEYVFPSPDY